MKFENITQTNKFPLKNTKFLVRIYLKFHLVYSKQNSNYIIIICNINETDSEQKFSH